MPFEYKDWLGWMNYAKYNFLSITFESIIWNNKIQIYQNYKALNSKDIIPFWSPTSLLGSVLWRFVHVLACVCLGWCWVPPALASHPHGNEHSLGLPALHSGHTKGTLLSSEITALLDSPEINKRNSASTGSTHLATVHYTLYLPGEDTDVQHSQCGEKRRTGREWKVKGKKTETCLFVLLLLSERCLPSTKYFPMAWGRLFCPDLRIFTCIDCFYWQINDSCWFQIFLERKQIRLGVSHLTCGFPCALAIHC